MVVSVVNESGVGKVFVGDLEVSVRDTAQASCGIVSITNMHGIHSIFPRKSGCFTFIVVGSCQHMFFNTGLLNGFGQAPTKGVIRLELNVIIALPRFNTSAQSIIPVCHIRSVPVFVIDFCQVTGVVVLVVGFCSACPNTLFKVPRFGIGVVGAFAVVIAFRDQVSVFLIVDPSGSGIAVVVQVILPGGHGGLASGVIVGVLDRVLTTAPRGMEFTRRPVASVRGCLVGVLNGHHSVHGIVGVTCDRSLGSFFRGRLDHDGSSSLIIILEFCCAGVGVGLGDETVLIVVCVVDSGDLGTVGSESLFGDEVG